MGKNLTSVNAKSRGTSDNENDILGQLIAYKLMGHHVFTHKIEKAMNKVLNDLLKNL